MAKWTIVYCEKGKVYKKNGNVISKKEYEKHFKGRDGVLDIVKAGKMGSQLSSTWPMNSSAAGCHPDQIGEAHAESVRQGVPTQFTSEGDAIFESRSHRKKYCEANGLFDRSGGYGDAQPTY